MSSFEEIRAAILKLPQAERRQLAAWLQALGAAPSSHEAHDSASALYAEIARSLGEVGFDLPRWDKFSRLKPAFAGSLRAASVQLDASMLRIFKGATAIERSALRGFLVDCARQRCKDDNRALAVRTILDALFPLEELLDNRFPELRTSGQLSPVLLDFIHKQESHVR